MFLCIHVNNFNKKHILINNKIRNNIITDSYFYRLFIQMKILYQTVL